MTDHRRPAASLITVVALFALMVTFSLLYVTIQAGIVAMIGLVFVFLAVGGISLIFFRGFTQTGLAIYDKRLSAEMERNRHVRAMAELELKYNRRQIEPPTGAPITDSEMSGYRNLARELAGVTMDKLGPQSNQLLPFNRAQKEKLSPFDDVGMWQNAMKWFLQNGYAYDKKSGEKSQGIFLLNGYTVKDVFEKLMN